MGEQGDGRPPAMSAREYFEAAADPNHPRHGDASAWDEVLRESLSASPVGRISEAFAALGRNLQEVSSRQVSEWSAPVTVSTPPSVDVTAVATHELMRRSFEQQAEMTAALGEVANLLSAQLSAAQAAQVAEQAATADALKEAKRQRVVTWVGVVAAIVLGLGGILATVLSAS